MKYIVMEVKRSYAVLLDEDGRFVTAANLRYEVGQIVENPVLMIDSGDNQKKKKRLITGFAAVLTLLILLFAALFWYDSFTDSYASIYFSVNPQVEIEVNKSGRVIDLDDLNDDGEDLIEDYRYWGRKKTEVIEDLIDRAYEMHYLSGRDTVVLEIDAPDDRFFEKYKSELTADMNRYTADNSSLTVEIIRYDDEKDDDDDDDDADDKEDEEDQDDDTEEDDTDDR